MKVVLICTTDLAFNRSSLYDRLLSSIEGQLGGVTAINVITVFQNCEPEQLEALRHSLPGFVAPYALPTRVSLSAARNYAIRMLRTTMAMESGRPDIIGFPDDDSWYTSCFFAELAPVIQRPDIDYWFCRYCAEPVLTCFASKRVLVKDVVRSCSSATVFVKFSLMTAVGDFDEKIGLGTDCPGGEDTDFGIRLFLSSSRGLFCSSALIGHRTRVSGQTRYMLGSTRAIARYARHDKWIAFELFRKILVWLTMVLRGDLPLREACSMLSALPVWCGERSGLVFTLRGSRH